MAATSITLTKLVRYGDGRIVVSFGKRGREFASLADLRAFVADKLDRDVMEALLLRIALDRFPIMDSPAQLEGRKLTVDTSLTNVMRVT